MQRAVTDAAVGREIERASQRVDERHPAGNGHRSIFTKHDVERLAHRVFLREIGRAMFEAGGDGRSDVGMREIRGDERVQLRDERGGLFGREIETKHLDRHEPIAIGAGRLVRTKHRTQRARTNLMENPERPE